MELVADQFQLTIVLFFTIFLLLAFNQAQNVTYCGQPISDGKVVIDVSFLGLHVRAETRSLCEEASCPIAAGNFKLSQSQTLPVFTPPGSNALQMILNDQNNLELTCIGINFTIGIASLASDI
ncbi:PREDICTED: putative phosphatidylglycerol/phosphatidylinositol transfer protein DDB_G0278295 [Theobroma cacao]|uniref:Phosphatidylglycerol/phosphatidylinositol transfer protein DDB_G0278295 n=1 Tax=Theobroma cacao TaxID=3641 RepID=A0AB32WX72_THECC|nr:PREDICTED: putative phosphatidylglycerol/phosphatidylinositol transfer protein DDB_G0278295 [Theobroma cacao]